MLQIILWAPYGFALVNPIRTALYICPPPEMKGGTGIPEARGTGIPEMKGGHWNSRGGGGTGLDEKDYDDVHNGEDETASLGTVAGLP